MKVAIISLPLLYNYGGYLQCYALMETVRVLGHEVVFIQREKGEHDSFKKRSVNIIKTAFENIGLGQLVYLVEKMTNTGLYYKTKNFRAFKKKYIKDVSPYFSSSDAISSFCSKKNYNAYITGSDQIWRKYYTRSINDAFLGFAPENSIKIAYAPSFGTNEWEFDPEETNFIEKQLATFMAISVRENEGVNLLNGHVKLKTKVFHVLDPTFLISINKYLEIAKASKRRKGILSYLLNNDSFKSLILDKVCSYYNEAKFSVINPLTNTSKIAGAQGYPIEDWIAGFRDATCIVTDSFHATVFSIIFNKPFWVIENKQRGNSRLLDILELFECNDRFITSDTDIEYFDFGKSVKWDKINNIKEQMKTKSMNFLVNALKNDRNTK